MIDPDENQQDICRVCRSEASPERPLYHPCICTGSIKFIHQECLVQWLKYSDKDYCELCNHKFSFIPIYAPDMPKRLPIKDITSGLVKSFLIAIRYWLHYTLVAVVWLGLVPYTAYRTYWCLAYGSFTQMLSSPLDLFSTDSIISDGFYGCCVVTCSMCMFMSLVWLREQIQRGGPEWLDLADDHNNVDPEEADALVADPEPLEEAEGGNQPQDANNNNDNLIDPIDIIAPPEPNADQINGVENNAQAVAANNPQLPAEPQAQAVVAPVDEINWNPPEWDRVGEDLTLERIVGLDGSLAFLEHAFWVVSLNSLLMYIFGYVPHRMGKGVLILLSTIFPDSSIPLTTSSLTTSFHLDGIIVTLLGYCMIATLFVTLHAGASLMRRKRFKRWFGMCYIIVKVSLLVVIEIGIFPLIFGWWLDVCSLPMLDATINDRASSFHSSPGTSLFIHWLVGMVYIFYFASFMLLLREMLRPGVLWFMDNINDPDFNPIHEMINLPLIRHVRRLIVTLVVFGTTVLLLVWFPVCIIQKVIPGFLPYNFALSNESPVSELSLEFLLLQLVLPALLDHGHLRQWMKRAIKGWCIGVSSLLGLRSYLMGDDPVVGMPDVQQDLVPLNDEVHDDVQDAAEIIDDGYKAPKLFGLRVMGLLILVAASFLTCGVLMLTVPVITGRRVISLWFGDVKVHELNTAACGLYVILLLTRAFTLLSSWIPRGFNAIANKMKEFLTITLKTAIAGFILLGLIPLLIGLLFDVVVIVPLRVGLNQTPIFYLWQDWAFGVLHTKVICGFAMMFEWRLRDILEEIYHGGIGNINLMLIFKRLAWPVILYLGLILAIPYFFINAILPLFAVSFEMQNLFIRRIYPALLLVTTALWLIKWHIHKFIHLYEHIKNDKYLVGRRLVNYDHRNRNHY